MKHIAHFFDKYEDLAETLSGIMLMFATGVAILGVAPLIVYMQLG